MYTCMGECVYVYKLFIFLIISGILSIATNFPLGQCAVVFFTLYQPFHIIRISLRMGRCNVCQQNIVDRKKFAVKQV